MKREFQKLTVWKYGQDVFEDQESCIRQMIADNTLELKEEIRQDFVMLEVEE